MKTLFHREVLLTMWLFTVRSSYAFTSLHRTSLSGRKASAQLFSSSSSLIEAVESGVSRLSVLQDLLSKHGAPGSQRCNEPNDLVPVVTGLEAPELLTSLTGQMDELSNLHPHLFPISKSKDSGNFICALRSPYSDDKSAAGEKNSRPWPIVEASLFGPGMRLLALNSEHLMRRIACENDFSEEKDQNLVPLYNDGLGKGLLKEAALDAPYNEGDAAKLGYGVEKYILLRVGPFPDLYEVMALQHKARGDEPSSLIAAETSNGKFDGFASTFRFYARLLNSFPSREEEARDAARVCLRLPLPTIGLSLDDFKEIAVLGQLAKETDPIPEAMEKLRSFYEKIRESEKDDPHQTSQDMSPEQIAVMEANYVLDTVALSGNCNWSETRGKLGNIYEAAGLEEMAAFVDPNKRG